MKYPLYFGRGGERMVAYDNESEKGDRPHFHETEEPYEFHSMVRLIEDFRRDVEEEVAKWKS